MFYRESDSKNSRKLFHFSLLHLPLLMGLMLITKEGLLSPANASNNKNINDSPVSAGQENSLQVRKKFSSPSENSSGSSFSGITLGTTLHAQVR